jgi:hypothetical protein
MLAWEGRISQVSSFSWWEYKTGADKAYVRGREEKVRPVRLSDFSADEACAHHDSIRSITFTEGRQENKPRVATTSVYSK